MKPLADALVRAVAYINCLPDPNEEHADEDVKILEDVAAYLAVASNEEKDALAVAAQSAFQEEQQHGRRPEYLNAYGSWMECMFGDEWTGNRRA